MENLKFVEDFEKNVLKTIKRFRLLKKDDKILVAVSGGKDSMSVLYVLRKAGYDVTAANVDSGIRQYNKTNLENIKKLTQTLGIRLLVFSFKEETGMTLPQIIKKLRSKNIPFTSCNICGILKRYILNKKARSMGFTKIVTGHNLDDEVQSFLMNLFRGNLEMAPRQFPVSGIANDKRFVPRVKPLFLSREHEVKKYSELIGLPIGHTICPHSDSSYRFSLKHLLWDYEKSSREDTFDNIIRYMLKLRPKLVKRYQDKQIGFCRYCGEPSKSDICSACRIMNLIKN